MQQQGREDPRVGGVALLVIAVGGLAMSVTLMALSMRAVMDVGGMCAEGGPYVIEQHCPEGSIPTMLLGIFGLIGFVFLGVVADLRVGGYGWLPIAAWTGLFAVLGWNFLDYGLIDPPEGEGIIWGWVIPGVLFEIMAWAPWVFAVKGWRMGSGGTVVVPAPMSGPRQPPRTQPPVTRAPAPAPQRAEPDGPSAEEAAQLREIASLMGAAIADAAADAPMDPDRRAAMSAEAGTGAFSEGTQALLDRLERLADMRDRGLLSPDEYETAKDAIVRELESRS